MTFSEDVEQILREHERTEDLRGIVYQVRPTRQQIIEEAVRLWARQARPWCDECGETEGHRPNCPADGIPERAKRFAALLRGDGKTE